MFERFGMLGIRAKQLIMNPLDGFGRGRRGSRRKIALSSGSWSTPHDQRSRHIFACNESSYHS